MSLGLQILAKKGVFQAVTWGLTLGNFLLIPIHGRVDCNASGRLGAGSFLLMIAVAILTQCVPPGAKRSFVPFFVSALAVISNSLFAH